MTVRIQSGTTVSVNNGQTVQTPQMQNAGTVTNSGTTQQFRSNIASGNGLGVGTARTSPLPLSSASGSGQATGSAIRLSQQFSAASGSGQATGSAIKPTSLVASASGNGLVSGTATVQAKNIIIASGSGRAIGDAARPIQGLASASGNGLMSGTATVQAKNTIAASGSGQATGSAIRPARLLSVATGSGQLAGTATASPQTQSVASGSGLVSGTATPTKKVIRPKAASGFGEMFGSARRPIPFDPIQQIVSLINKTNDSRWRYGKPDRIAPIWEYSHNDRINFPNAAFYIYTPTESTVDKFGIEGESFNQTITVEILIMTLEATETQGYVGDTAEFITQLYNDNTQNTVQFHRFGNITASDLRNEHMGQQTDHYLASVTFEIQRFKSVRDLESVGAFR
jgi:hypothetical protein